eukprot:TRINITY_DN4342_c0_g1_i1.p1 TRINITY_DN4342_c0_g1~~TRINITY_DN4342_c0_g1_i1.p1  ORF type:complete len:448 (+),score=23.73 TRINITY_DN4342_c0_g1_i1:313-1656(+)
MAPDVSGDGVARWNGWLLWGVVLMDMFAVGLVVPLLPYYATNLGADAAAYGTIGSVYGLLQLIGNPLIGRLSDIYGRKTLLAVSCAAAAISYFVLGVAPTLTVLILSRIPVGICKQTMSLSYAYIGDCTEPAHRAAQIGYVGTAVGLGFIVGPAAGGILSAYNYTLPAVVSSVVFVILFFVCLLYLADPVPTSRQPTVTPTTIATATIPTTTSNTTDYDASLVASNVAKRTLVSEQDNSYLMTAWMRVAEYFRFVAQVFRHPALLYLASIELVSNLSLTAYRSVFPLINQQTFGLDAKWNGFLLSYIGLLSVLVQGIFIRQLTKHFKESALIRTSVVLVGLSLVACSLTSSLWTLAVFLIPLTVFSGVLNTCILSAVTQEAPKADLGATVGVLGSMASICSALGPGLGGFLMAVSGPTGPGLYGGLLSVLVGMALFVHGTDAVMHMD